MFTKVAHLTCVTVLCVQLDAVMHQSSKQAAPAVRPQSLNTESSNNNSCSSLVNFPDTLLHCIGPMQASRKAWTLSNACSLPWKNAKLRMMKVRASSIMLSIACVTLNHRIVHLLQAHSQHQYHVLTPNHIVKALQSFTCGMQTAVRQFKQSGACWLLWSILLSYP